MCSPARSVVQKPVSVCSPVDCQPATDNTLLLLTHNEGWWSHAHPIPPGLGFCAIDLKIVYARDLGTPPISPPSDVMHLW